MSPASVVPQSIKKFIHRFRRKRNPRLALLARMPENAVCAEIGVWKGDFSELILNITTPQQFHLVDPWEFQSEYSERMYGGAVARSQADMDEICEGVKNRFERFDNVAFNRGKSENVLQDFPDRYFDWVYIDGNHYYEYVLKDLNICFEKVKTGGFIAGDDYTWGEADGFPVKMAVQDFVDSKGLQDSLTVIDSQFIIGL